LRSREVSVDSGGEKRDEENARRAISYASLHLEAARAELRIRGCKG
jgi:hypothetical protein